MFLPNNTGTLTRKLGTDKFGQAVYSQVPTKVGCGVVSLNIEVIKTAIRTDASASRGTADEDEAIATILFPAGTIIGEEDKFEIAGFALRVKAVQPRYSVYFGLDHIECDFEQWQT